MTRKEKQKEKKESKDRGKVEKKKITEQANVHLIKIIIKSEINYSNSLLLSEKVYPIIIS